MPTDLEKVRVANVAAGFGRADGRPRLARRRWGQGHLGALLLQRNQLANLPRVRDVNISRARAGGRAHQMELVAHTTSNIPLGPNASARRGWRGEVGTLHTMAMLSSWLYR